MNGSPELMAQVLLKLTRRVTELEEKHMALANSVGSLLRVVEMLGVSVYGSEDDQDE